MFSNKYYNIMFVHDEFKSHVKYCSEMNHSNIYINSKSTLFHKLTYMHFDSFKTFLRNSKVNHDKDLIKCVPVHHHQRVTARWISNNTFKLLLNIDIVPKKVELVPLDNIIDTVKYAFEMQRTCYRVLI